MHHVHAKLKKAASLAAFSVCVTGEVRVGGVGAKR